MRYVEGTTTTHEAYNAFEKRLCVILSGTVYCSPTCKLFKCGKNAATHQRNNVWCRWTDEPCQVANCNYATCAKRRLLPRGICGESIKRKTVEIEPEKTAIPTVRLKGKAFRKLGEKEIF